jgi:uncharacterized membrane protein
MAKSFKQLAAKPEAPKRTSEKDILDFLEQEQPAKSVIPSKNSQVDNSNNTSNTRKTKSSAHREEATSTPERISDSIADVTGVTEDDIDVRQTFIVGQQYLDRLKDYVHTKRMSGQYEYTQKQALHEALDKLFEGATIEVRPAHIRQQEESRKQRIRRGIAK